MTAITKDEFSACESSTTSPMALFAHKNSWYFDTGATNHLCNTRDAFTSYTEFNIPQAREDIGGSIKSMGKGTLRLNVQPTDQSIMLIKLHDVYNVPSSIANLVSDSSLFKKGFYFHGGKCTLNRISDDKEVAYAPMINGLFVLQVIRESVIALSPQDSAFTWHRRLRHIGLDSLKKVLGGRSLDSKEVTLI